MKISWYKILLACIILSAIAFRIYVIEYFPMGDLYQVDLHIGNPSTLNDYDEILNIDNYEDYERGHFYNILYIYKYHKIYSDSKGQSYHPPIHYLFTSMLLTIVDKLNFNSKQMVEGIQYIRLIYFCISIYLIIKILDKLELSNKSKLIVLLLYSFFPKIIYICTSVTNDYLVFVFQLLEILLLINWNEKSNYKNTIILSLIYGLGNLVKYNNCIMAIPIAIMFLMKLIKNRKNFIEIMNYIVKGILFVIIAFSISVSFFLYCIIETGTYTVAQPKTELFIADQGALANFGIDLKNMIFLGSEAYRNVWVGFLYTSLVEKYGFESYIGIANIFILIANGIFFINFLKKREENKNMKLMIFIFLIYFLSYIIYNIRLPYTCTYNSRYILICLFLSNVFVGKIFDDINNKLLRSSYFGFTLVFIIISILQFV